MNLEKLKHLETELSESEDFKEIFTYFMDHFADAPSFIRDSKKAKAPLVQAMIQSAAAAVFQKTPIRVTGFRSLIYERLSLLHGGGFVEGTIFNFFYCKRTNKGMLAIVTKTGSTELVRITPISVDGSKLGDDLMD